MNTPPRIHCPNCGAADTRKSHSRSIADVFLQIFGFVAYRCRACQNRFHKRPSAESPEDATEPRGGSKVR